MKKSEKIEIQQNLYTFSAWELEGDLIKFGKIANFKEYWRDTILKQNPHNQHDINQYHKFTVSYNTPYEESTEFYITGWRWETDEEFSIRKEKNRKAVISGKQAAIKAKENKEIREKAEFERLKIKYEKT